MFYNKYYANLCKYYRFATFHFIKYIQYMCVGLHVVILCV